MARASLAALCAATVFAASANAAVLTVNNNADTLGAGTFRTAIGSATTGSDGITWATTNGGTITLGSALPAIKGGTQIVVSSAASAVTIAGAGANAMVLGGDIGLTNDNVSQTLTISAPIIGLGGNINKFGGGELDLLGVNAFTGGVILSSGTLGINSDASLGDASGTFTINTGTVSFTGVITSSRAWALNGSAFVVDNGNSSTITGSIGGGGSLTKSGAGIMELGGTNGYSGGTTLNAGTLRIDNNSGIGGGPLTINGGAFQFNGTSLTLSVPVTLNTNTAGFDTMGNQATVAGAIGGTGGLVMTSSGTLILTGANTYLSSTTVSGGGRLVITNDGNLGAPGTSLTLSNGSALQFGSLGHQTFSFTRPIVLGAGGGGIDDGGNSVAYSGVISGAGAFTKTGAGTLTLLSANTYTGSTTVNAGMLALGAAGALGTGALQVQSGALLDMGANAQTVAAYSGAGTLAMALPSQANVLTVTGNANFTGTTLKVTLAPQVVTAGEVFKPVHYGSITGLPTVNGPALISLTPSAGATDLLLTASLVPMASVAANANQAAVGAALEAVRQAPTGDMATVIGALNTLDAGGVQAALDQLGPVSLGAVGGIGLAQASAQASAVQRRMNALARSDNPEDSTVQRYSVTGRSAYPGQLFAEAPGDDLPFDTHASGSRWGFFSSAIVGTGKVQDLPSPSGTQPGYTFNTDGLSAGGDYRLNEHVAVGAAAGYLHGHAGILAPASGTMSSNSGRLGGYGTVFGENFAANLYVGGAVDAFTTNRGISIGGLSRTATGTPHGKELNVHPSASYDVKTRDYGTFSPFAAFDYDELWIGSFQETGAGSLDLSVGAQTQVTEQSALGLRYSRRLKTDTHIFTPYGSLGWRHAFNDQSRPITSSLAGSAPFTVMTGRVAREGTLVGVGLDVAWNKDLSLKLDYSGDYRSHYQDSDISLSARLRF